MRNYSTIDNIKTQLWGLSLQEAYLFDWIYSLPSWASNIMSDGEIFYYAARTKAISDLPILTDKPDTMYRHYKGLQDKGLIEIKKFDNKDYIKLTNKAKEWNTFSDNSEKNPKPSGKKSDNEAEKNPTNSIISNNSLFIDNDLSEKKEFPFFVDDFSIDSFTDLEIETLKSSAFIYVGKGGAGEKNKLSLAVPASWTRERLGMFYEWLRYKKEIGKPCNTKATITLLIRNIGRFEIEEVREGLDKCISSGYQGLFINKLNNGNSKTQSNYLQGSTGKRPGFIFDDNIANILNKHKTTESGGGERLEGTLE